MKLSVSVPDDLWESARSVIEGDSPSGVVQEALRRVTVAHGAEVGYAQPPAMDDELAASLAATRQRLLEEARGLYQAGYHRGIELAGRLDWTQLRLIVGRGIVPASEYLKDQKHRLQTGEWELPPDSKQMIDPDDVLAEYTGGHASNHMDWKPPSETVEGMDRALRDVWEQVRSPTRAATSPPAGSDDTETAT